MTVERTTRPHIPCSHCGGMFRPNTEQYGRYLDAIPVCCKFDCRIQFARDQKARTTADLQPLTCADPACGRQFTGSPWQYRRHQEGHVVYHSPACARRASAKKHRDDHAPDAAFRHKLDPPVRCPWETGAIKRSTLHCPMG